MMTMTPLLQTTWGHSTPPADSSHALNTTDHMDPDQDFPFYLARRYLRVIYQPFLLLFGLFGNVMIIVIMRRMTSGDSAIHVYFITTATFDVMFLLTCTLVEWVRYAFGFDLTVTHDAVCKTLTWFFTGGGTVSCWCLVSMTVHRAMSVVWPHRVNVMCTRRTVTLVLSAIGVFFALLYSHYFIGFETMYVASSGETVCTARMDYAAYIYFLEYVYVYVELTVYCLLPFTILVLSNSVLVWKLCLSVKVADQQFATAQKDDSSSSEQAHSREKAANSVTLMVVSVSLAFVVLTLPISLAFMLSYLDVFHSRLTGQDLARNAFVFSVCEMLGQTNSAVNFYLYCLTGRRFREEFLKVVRCAGRR